MFSYIKDLRREFHQYDSTALCADIWAAVQVAALTFPLCFAYGVSTGLGALSGVLSALIAGIVIAVFSGCRYHIAAPTSAMCAVLITISAQYGLKGILISGLIAGIIMIIASFLHIGRLISFIPTPVFSGFMVGISIVFAIGQIDNFFAVQSHGTNIIEKFISYGQLGFSPNLIAMMFGLLSLAIMIFWPKAWKDKVPAPLVAVLIPLIINFIFRMDAPHIGHLRPGFFADITLTPNDFTWDNFTQFIFPAVSIAALAIIESSATGSYAAKKTKEPFDQEREIFAQGLGNLLCPLFGALPATTDQTYTRLNISYGAKTRLSSLLQALIIWILFFLLSPLLSYMPLSSLAGVLMVTAFRIVDWKTVFSLFKRHFFSSIIQFIITMLLTVFVNLTFAIVFGIIIAMFIFVARSCELKVEISDVDANRLTGAMEPRDFTKTKLVYLTGPLFFGTQDRLYRALSSLSDTDAVILSMRGVPSVDPSAIRILEDVVDDYEAKKVHLLFCGVQSNVKATFDRTGLTEKIQPDHFFWDAIAAIKYLS